MAAHLDRRKIESTFSSGLNIRQISENGREYLRSEFNISDADLQDFAQAGDPEDGVDVVSGDVELREFGTLILGDENLVDTSSLPPQKAERIRDLFDFFAQEMAKQTALASRQGDTDVSFDVRPPAPVGIRGTGQTSVLAPQAADQRPPLTPDEVILSAPVSTPGVLLVNVSATREEIATALYGDPTRTDDFDIVTPQRDGGDDALGSEDAVAVMPRDPADLTKFALAKLRPALEAAVVLDAARTADKLRTDYYLVPGEVNELVFRSLKWSQLSEFTDARGNSYFDRYLLALKGEKIGRSNALERLQARTDSEQLEKAIKLRSDAVNVRYKVRDTDRSGKFSPGAVIGRFYWAGEGGEGSLQLRVGPELAVAHTREEAEILTRNSPFQAMRAVVEQEVNGERKYVGYGIVHANLDLLVQGPAEGAEGRFFWYHRTTIFIPEGNSPGDLFRDSPTVQATQQRLLDEAIRQAGTGDLHKLYALQLDVLARASIDERLRIVKLVVQRDSFDSEKANQLLARVILSVQNDDFPAFERKLSTTGLYRALLRNDRGLRPLARVFTLKTLSSIPIGGEALDNMPVLRIGSADWTKRWAFGVPVTVKSQLVPPSQWAPEDAPSFDPSRPIPGREPALPGEAAGTVDRAAIRFDLQSQYRLTPADVKTEGSSGPYLPTQLVMVQVDTDDGPQFRIVTALEAAAMTSGPGYEAIVQSGTDAVTVALMAQAGMSLAATFGPAFVNGAARGGMSAGLRAMAAHAATEAGKQALRQFAFDAGLLATVLVVEENRSALEKTEAGRKFLAAYDVAMVGLLAYGGYRLLNSGMVERLARLGNAAVKSLSGRAQAAARRIEVELQALQKTFKTMSEADELVAVTTNGTRVMVPGSEQRFGHLLMMARGDVATKALVGRLPAGAGKTTAQETLAWLQGGATTREARRAYAAIANHANALPTAKEAEAFLGRIARIRSAGKPPAVVADLLVTATKQGSLAQQLQYLEAVQALVSKSALTQEALKVLGQKARQGKLDVVWLMKETNLSAETINFLGKDSQTPWRLLQRASATSPMPSKSVMMDFQRRVRGMAGEKAAEAAVKEWRRTVGAPAYRIDRRQVPAGNSKLDYRLVSTGDGPRATALMEVKGWNRTAWTNAIEAGNAKIAGETLKGKARDAYRKMQHLIKQLKDATAHGTDAPFLMVTDDIAHLVPDLRNILSYHGLGNVRIVYMAEGQIAAASAQIRGGLGLPVKKR